MPLTHSMATRLGKKLTDVRKNGDLWWLRPDGKTQVTIEYLQRADGSVEPRKIHTVVISTQHAEPLKAVRSKEVAGHSGPEETAPSMEEMNKLIEEKVIRKTLEEIILKNGQPAFTQIYHWWSSRRRWSDGKKDHHRHIRRLGRSWWWCLLGQGSYEGGQVCRLHLQTDGQVCGEERAEQTVLGAAFIRDWRGETPVSLCRDVWNRAGKSDRRRHYERPEDRVRLQTWSHCRLARAPRAEVSGDSCVLPFRT